jgi:hypothetical protein
VWPDRFFLGPDTDHRKVSKIENGGGTAKRGIPQKGTGRLFTIAGTLLQETFTCPMTCPPMDLSCPPMDWISPKMESEWIQG